MGPRVPHELLVAGEDEGGLLDFVFRTPEARDESPTLELEGIRWTSVNSGFWTGVDGRASMRASN
jgi:hypothetical protein